MVELWDLLKRYPVCDRPIFVDGQLRSLRQNLYNAPLIERERNHLNNIYLMVEPMYFFEEAVQEGTRLNAAKRESN